MVLEVLIVDVNHRSLTQCRQRLVRRMCGVDTHASLIRIGHQACVQPGVVVRRIGCVKFGSPFGVFLSVTGVFEATSQFCGRPHGGTSPQDR